VELDDIRKVVEELDNRVSKENARVGLYQYGGNDDESYMVATRNGYLRFGIELLKAGITPATFYESPTADVDVDLHYLLDDQSTVYFDTFELAEELPVKEVEESWGDTVFIYTIIAVLIVIPILAIVGLIAVVRMLL
jgi:hypothetical protein